MMVRFKKIKKILVYVLIHISFSFMIAQEWEQSFSAGYFDENGIFMGGSEVLHLVAHKKKIFAAIGYWEDESNVWYGGSDLSIGWSQIICLESEDDSWKVDLELGYNYLRPEILKQIIFTKDYNGVLLTDPDTLLIAGAYSPNYISGIVNANIFIRDDENNLWHEVLVYEGDFSSNESYSMRDIELYTDQVTGIEKLIISIGTQGIFSAVYNPNLEGKIEAELIPEFGPLGIRSLGIEIANEKLYFSSGNKIFKRNDGVNPTYEVVHNFTDLSSYVNSAVGGIRGLSTIQNPFSSNESMLLMWCPDGQSKGTIFRLDPAESQEFNRIYETKISLLVEDYLTEETVDYLLGAYNEFYSYRDPLTNINYNIIGIESLLQGNIYPTWNNFYRGGLIVLRDDNSEYLIQEINGVIDFNDDPLVSVRCYVESPFENENAIYFGGFDPNGYISTNNAWIYRKSWNYLANIRDSKSKSITDYNIYNNYPNPFNLTTTIPYSILKDNFINIIVYDVVGNKIKVLVDNYKRAGNYKVYWNGENENAVSVSSGIYFYTIEVGNFKQIKKMIFLK